MEFTRYIVLALVLVSVCVGGCARRQKPAQLTMYREQQTTAPLKSAPDAALAGQKQANLTPFQEIVVTLVSDSLDLLPNNASSRIFDVILQGMQVPDQHDTIERSVLTSPRKEDIGFLAGLIVQQIFGENVKEGTTAPQVILFFHKDKVAYGDLTAAASRLNSSENRSLDAYNTCLNLLVNALANNYALPQKPAEGLYIRNSKGDLYFHTKLKHVDM